LNGVIINELKLGIGDWGLGMGPNPQSPIPNPQILIITKSVLFNLLLLNSTEFKNQYKTILNIIT